MMRRLAFYGCFLIPCVFALVFLLEALLMIDGRGSSDFAIALVIVPYALFLSWLGFLMVTRRPENVIGPGFCILAVLTGLWALGSEYVVYGQSVAGGEAPGLALVAWLSEWLFVPAVFLPLTFLFLLSPDGRLPSPRWRPVALAIVVNLGILIAGIMLSPFESAPELANPFRIEALGAAPRYVTTLGYVGLIPSFVASTLAMVLRFRRATGVQRQQLKWLASAAVFSVALFLGSWATVEVTGSETPWMIFLGGSLTSVVVATALAVLRYRLYEVDRLLNRTLVYGLLTAGLGALYVVLVFGLQVLLRRVSGGSELAIVTTTLLVAALFLPARRWVQSVVDRRFNRRAYDAARTVETFSARLRDQIDLDTLRQELLSVVDETMEPSRASVWLRGNGQPG